MNIFTVYTKYSRDEQTLEDVVFVEEKFSWIAFFFGPFFALYHRLWLLLGSVIFFNLLNFFPIITDSIGKAGMGALHLALITWIGANAQDWIRGRLSTQGYILQDIVSGLNQQDAERRFYDRYLPNRSYNAI